MIAVVPFVFFLFLGKLLQVSNGEFRLDFLLMLLAAWSATTLLSWRGSATRSAPSRTFATRVAALGLVYFAVELALHPMVQYNEYRPSYQAIKALTILAAFASALAGGLAWRKEPGKAFWAFCGIAGASWFGCKVLTVAYSPHPYIDVFTIPTEAADYFFAGLSPYGQKYKDIYNGYYNYSPLLPYWPGVLYPEFFSRRLLGDIRYAFVLADLATVVGLVRLLRSFRAPAALKGLLPLSWLCFPVTLHVLELSWTDTFLVAATVWVAWAVAERRWRLAGVLLGYAVSVKQYSVFFAALLAFVAWYRGGARGFARITAAALATFAVVVGSMAMRDFGAFYASTIRFLMDIGIRGDALSIPGALVTLKGYTLPGPWMSGTYLGLLVLAGAWLVSQSGRMRGWAGTLVFVYGGVYLMGKQAFCNYYYLLAFFSLLAFACAWEYEAEA